MALDSDDALYALCTKALGDFFDSFQTDFSVRLKAQKTVSLLQDHFGMPQCEPFNWYISGPYSPALAVRLYSIAQADERPTLDSEGEDVGPWVDKAKTILQRCPDKLPEADWLELAASLAFWRARAPKGADEDQRDEYAKEKVVLFKRRFRDDVDAALGVLNAIR